MEYIWMYWIFQIKHKFGMPRVRLFNTIFHLQKINAKLMLNSWKTIFSLFFVSLNNIVSNNLQFLPFLTYYAEMRRKLWPKAPSLAGALGQMSKNFQVYCMHINFFKKPNKKNNNRTKEVYIVATIFVFWFFIVYLPKKNRNWKMAQGCWLSPTIATSYKNHPKQVGERSVR